MTDPEQIEHTSAMTMTLQRFAKMLGIHLPDHDQSDKNPSCSYVAGSWVCLNAASSMCNDCGWWDRQCEDGEREDNDTGCPADTFCTAHYPHDSDCGLCPCFDDDEWEDDDGV